MSTPSPKLERRRAHRARLKAKHAKQRQITQAIMEGLMGKKK